QSRKAAHGWSRARTSIRRKGCSTSRLQGSAHRQSAHDRQGRSTHVTRIGGTFEMDDMDVILLGLLGSTAAGFMTVVGALPALFGRAMSARQEDALLGFAAGVMLAASFFSLLLPAIGSASSLFAWRFAPGSIAALVN